MTRTCLIFTRTSRFKSTASAPTERTALASFIFRTPTILPAPVPIKPYYFLIQVKLMIRITRNFHTKKGLAISNKRAV